MPLPPAVSQVHVSTSLARPALTSGQDGAEIVLRAELDEALNILRTQVDAELQTFKTELKAIVDRVDSYAWASTTRIARPATNQAVEASGGDAVEILDGNGMGSAHIDKPDTADSGRSSAQVDSYALVVTNTSCPNTSSANPRPATNKAVEGDGGEIVDVKVMGSAHIDKPDAADSGLCSHLKLKRISNSGDQSASHVDVRDYVASQQAFYIFCNTLWDASTFVGTKTMGSGASILVCVLLAIAIFTQAVYIYIINDLLVADPMSDEQLLAMQHWRARVAHDVRWIDPVTGASLASRVCSFNAALELSTTQKQLAESITRFLPKSIVDGPNVCLLAIGSFLTVVIVEIRICATWMFSLFQILQVSRGTQISLQKEASKKLKLESIGRVRFAITFLLGLIRLSIAVGLGYVATRYLVYTSSVQTLFLMAMKFAFVLNVDELLCQALLPHVIKVFLSQVAPLPAPHRLKSWGGIDRTSVVCITTFAAFLIAVKFHGIDAVRGRLEVFSEIVCGGNTGFVYAMNPTTGVLEWTKTEESSNTYLEDAVKELVELPSLDESAKLSSKATLFRVQDVKTMRSGQRYSDEFGENICKDRLDFFRETRHFHYTMVKSVLSSKAGYDVSSCKNISIDLCDHAYMSEARALCPLSCGCGDFSSGLFANTPGFGCGPSCYSKANVQYRLRDVKCVDLTKEELRDNWAWNRYWNGMTAYRDSQFLSEHPAMGKQIAFDSGCEIVSLSRLMGYDLCTRHPSGGSLIAFCPITCGCGKDGHTVPGLVCPPKCEDPLELRSDARLRFNCSGVLRLGRRRQCTLLLSGQVQYEFKSLDEQCCATFNELTKSFLVNGTIEDALVKQACCLDNCVDEVFSVQDIADLFGQTGKGPDMCLA